MRSDKKSSRADHGAADERLASGAPSGAAPSGDRGLGRPHARSHVLTSAAPTVHRHNGSGAADAMGALGFLCSS